MFSVLVVLQVIIAIALIGLVLIQHGKGADAGAAFGAGASGTVFGARGSANFLSRSTAALAAAFFITSLALAYMVSHGSSQSSSLADQIANEAQKQPPAIVIEEDLPTIPEESAEEAAPQPVEIPE
ncbi:MAG: preprotein translocase subunit SecG [Nevskiales bacterium]